MNTVIHNQIITLEIHSDLPLHTSYIHYLGFVHQHLFINSKNPFNHKKEGQKEDSHTFSSFYFLALLFARSIISRLIFIKIACSFLQCVHLVHVKTEFKIHWSIAVNFLFRGTSRLGREYGKWTNNGRKVFLLSVSLTDFSVMLQTSQS